MSNVEKLKKHWTNRIIFSENSTLRSLRFLLEDVRCIEIFPDFPLYSLGLLIRSITAAAIKLELYEPMLISEFI